MTQFLDPLDSAFVLLEVPGSAMNIGAIVELEFGDVADPKERYELIRNNIEARLHEIPVLSQRLVRSPFDMTWPIMVNEKKIEIEKHVIRVALPAPGTPDQFDELISQFLSQQLSPKRPLWQLLVIEGMQDGRAAVALKVHHALADGVSGAETFASLFDISPEVRPPAPKIESDEEETVTTSFGLLRQGIGSIRKDPSLALRNVSSWFVRLYTIVKAVVRVAILRRKNKATPEQPSLFEAKRTSLNAASATEKEFHRLQVSLADSKKAAKSRGASVTDFVMAVSSGALRRLLEDRGEAIKKDLIAFVPINVRGEGEAAALGNQISGMLVRLHTNIDDPEERIKAISADSKKTVGAQRQAGAQMLQNITKSLGPTLLSIGGKLIHNFGLFNKIPPMANVMISSVPGPPLPLWLSGHRVASAAPVGPLFGPFALNRTVLGFEEYLEFGIYGCAETMPDISKLRDYLREEVEAFIASSPAL